MKWYNCNRNGHYYRNCPDWLFTKGEDNVNVRTVNTAASNNNNSKNNVMDDSGKDDTTLDATDLYDYEPSYGGYTFSKPSAIVGNTTTTTKPRKTYLKAAQG